MKKPLKILVAIAVLALAVAGGVWLGEYQHEWRVGDLLTPEYCADKVCEHRGLTDRGSYAENLEMVYCYNATEPDWETDPDISGSLR